ncbi:unnamed protein product [Protopolystoma xenopodis]|uniref:Uncharacterized protein n=1 Tax=Protopolystoma xenopodis TaxID=117903 RepID=A0A448XG38_9PLAT|nr:unnamed protein product [Protopolystoma xenopodis]
MQAGRQAGRQAVKQASREAGSRAGGNSTEETSEATGHPVHTQADKRSRERGSWPGTGTASRGYFRNCGSRRGRGEEAADKGERQAAAAALKSILYVLVCVHACVCESAGETFGGSISEVSPSRLANLPAGRTISLQLTLSSCLLCPAVAPFRRLCGALQSVCGRFVRPDCLPACLPACLSARITGPPTAR